jgi:hypothetical protein
MIKIKFIVFKKNGKVVAYTHQTLITLKHTKS